MKSKSKKSTSFQVYDFYYQGKQWKVIFSGDNIENQAKEYQSKIKYNEGYSPSFVFDTKSLLNDWIEMNGYAKSVVYPK